MCRISNHISGCDQPKKRPRNYERERTLNPQFIDFFSSFLKFYAEKLWLGRKNAHSVTLEYIKAFGIIVVKRVSSGVSAWKTFVFCLLKVRTMLKHQYFIQTKGRYF